MKLNDLRAALNLAAPHYPPTAGALVPIPISKSFDAAVRDGKYVLTKNYKFGTAATGSDPIIPIRNITELAVHFNAQSVVVGTSVQNSEVERFQDFNTTNHVFNANDLALTATLDPGGTFDVVEKLTVGAVTSSTVLTFANTTGVVDSMLVALAAGQTVGNIRVISHDATTVTLSTAVTVPNNTKVQFLPCYVVPSVVAGSSSMLTFPSVPEAVQPGMFYTNISDGTFATRVVQSVTPTTVVLDGGATRTTGAFIFFQPPVRSAQIWSKDVYQPGKNGVTAVAFELTCTIPSEWGGWPAFWLYSNSLDGPSFNGCEIDVFEFFNSLTADSGAYTSNIHWGGYNVRVFKKGQGSTDRWDSFGFYRPTGVDFALAQHKFQLIWTPDRVYRYIDGDLTVVHDYLWDSESRASWSCDLACGSFITSFLAIFFYPQSTAQFPFDFKLNEVKIWQL